MILSTDPVDSTSFLQCFPEKAYARIVVLVQSLRCWQTRTHCCGHIVADLNVSLFARARNICCGHKFCVRDTKNVSDFVQKHFVSATNVSQFAQPKKHHAQQCVLVCQHLYRHALCKGRHFLNQLTLIR